MKASEIRWVAKLPGGAVPVEVKKLAEPVRGFWRFGAVFPPGAFRCCGADVAASALFTLYRHAARGEAHCPVCLRGVDVVPERGAAGEFLPKEPA